MSNKAKIVVTIDIEMDLDEWEGGVLSIVDTRRDVRQYVYNSVSELPMLSEVGAVVSLRGGGHDQYLRP